MYLLVKSFIVLYLCLFNLEFLQFFSIIQCKYKDVLAESIGPPRERDTLNDLSGSRTSINHSMVEVYHRAHNRGFSKRINKYAKARRILVKADSVIIQRRCHRKGRVSWDL